MKASDETKSAIMAMLDKLSKSYESGDAGAALEMFAKDESATAHIGTGEDEWCSSFNELEAQIKRDMTQYQDRRLNFTNTKISQSGKVCWLSTAVTFSMNVKGKEQVYKGRCTAVLELLGDRWQFVQTHFSLPMNIEEMKGVKAA